YWDQLFSLARWMSNTSIFRQQMMIAIPMNRDCYGCCILVWWMYLGSLFNGYYLLTRQEQ
ncbi:hypothetical protein KAT72_03945, partial [Aeromonas popoffii]